MKCRLQKRTHLLAPSYKMQIASIIFFSSLYLIDVVLFVPHHSFWPSSSSSIGRYNMIRANIRLHTHLTLYVQYKFNRTIFSTHGCSDEKRLVACFRDYTKYSLETTAAHYLQTACFIKFNLEKKTFFNFSFFVRILI